MAIGRVDGGHLCVWRSNPEVPTHVASKQAEAMIATQNRERGFAHVQATQSKSAEAHMRFPRSSDPPETLER